jgi:hypothetical protein
MILDARGLSAMAKKHGEEKRGFARAWANGNDAVFKRFLAMTDWSLPF